MNKEDKANAERLASFMPDGASEDEQAFYAFGFCEAIYRESLDLLTDKKMRKVIRLARKLYDARMIEREGEDE